MIRLDVISAHFEILDGLDADANAVRRAATCLYTEAPGARFLVERLQEGGPIVASACSGHGFKHSAALGEALAAWGLSGVRPACLAPFAAPGFTGN